MQPNRPEYIDPKICPDCGEKMDFVGVVPSGLVQFFCENCTYRRDRVADPEVVEKYFDEEQEDS